MYVIATILEFVVLGIIVAEIWLGIAVTGWQGEKPYVVRNSQPIHFWSVMVVQFAIGIVLPILYIYLAN